MIYIAEVDEDLAEERKNKSYFQQRQIGSD